MAWYDLFSRWYDASLERLYAEQRVIAADALALAPGQVVLDLPTGTGQSLPLLADRVGPTGRIVAMDLSAGMLARARERVARRGWENVSVILQDVHALEPSVIADATGGRAQVDRVHVFLGLSAFPRWEEAFERIWAVLAPGGRCVVVDVHADPIGVQGRLVNLVARADIRRRTWELLERKCVDFQRISLPQRREHGGEIFCAVGTKAAA